MADTPNVVCFFSDQQRWDTVGAYGQELEVTPRLDQMAEEGVRFEHAFTCLPVCGPARAALQTGKFPEAIGCRRNNIHLPQDEKTIAHRFTEWGYQTGYVGKWRLASGPEPERNYREPGGGNDRQLRAMSVGGGQPWTIAVGPSPPPGRRGQSARSAGGGGRCRRRPRRLARITLDEGVLDDTNAITKDG